MGRGRRNRAPHALVLRARRTGAFFAAALRFAGVFFVADFPSPSVRFRFADGRLDVATFLVLLVPAVFLLLPLALRSPATPVLFLTFATSAPRLLQQMLHEFGIFSVS